MTRSLFRGRARALAAGLALVALWAAPAAHADSLFYVKSGDVYASRPDGSGEVRITTDGTNAWPSQADDGTFALTDVVDGRIHRAGPDGSAINSMTTSGSYAAGKPDTVRPSPDGSKIVYRILFSGDYHVFWTPSDSTSINTPGQSLGQESYGSPSWIGNTDLFLSHNGTTLTPDQPSFATYHVGNGDNTLQSGGTEPDSSWQNAYSSAISRDGTRVAAIEDDTGDDAPSRTELHIFTTNATVPTELTLRCTLTLPNGNIFYSSPSFSPDGTQLAFAESDGVHVVALGDLSACPAAAALVIPGANMSFWGAADPPVLRQGSTGGGGGTVGGGGDATGGSAGSLTTPRSYSIRRLLKRGMPVTVGVTTAGSLVKVELLSGSARAARSTVLARVVKRRARAGRNRLTLRITRKGRAVLRHARSKRASVRLTITPPGGGPQAATNRIRLKR